MVHKKRRRKYIKFNPVFGYPVDHNLFYECLICGDIISSIPLENWYCKCRNIMIDIDYGRIDIQEASKIKLFYLLE